MLYAKLRERHTILLWPLRLVRRRDNADATIAILVSTYGRTLQVEKRHYEKHEF